LTTDGHHPARSPAHAPEAYLGTQLVCPACHGELRWEPETISCNSCSSSYERTEGIPIFTKLDRTTADAATLHKLSQAEFFDSESDEWEIGRPRGAPQLYGWLLGEKFRRSVLGLESLLRGATVLTVCGGSGMDAEFLARRGASVVTSDISLGAALRARARAQRHGVGILPIVADVERLPFADRSVDITYVHDGLHHLRDPLQGLAEMTRVAARAVSVTEPARAAITALAVRAGIALEEEDAGNRVERIDVQSVARAFGAAGLRVVGSGRYGMYYRHEPGPAMRLFSRRRTVGLARLSINTFNAKFGALGNKLSVRAIRDVPKQ
jgi:SAM-dependent methyltransferase